MTEPVHVVIACEPFAAAKDHSVRFAYNEAAIELLKEAVPHSERIFDRGQRIWWVTPYGAELACRAFAATGCDVRWRDVYGPAPEEFRGLPPHPTQGPPEDWNPPVWDGFDDLAAELGRDATSEPL